MSKIARSIHNIIKDINLNLPKQTIMQENEFSNASLFPGRIFKDTTTREYTNIFLENTLSRTAFIDLTFHVLNSQLQTNINLLLIINNHQPLAVDEDIILNYKGGNVMNYYFNLLTTQYNLCSAKSKVKQISVLDSVTDNFKISDVDYSVYIKAQPARFTIIKKYTINLLTEALSKISLLFDNILNGKQISKINIFEGYGFIKKNVMINLPIFANEPILQNVKDIYSDGDIIDVYNILMKNGNDVNILEIIQIIKILQNKIFLHFVTKHVYFTSRNDFMNYYTSSELNDLNINSINITDIYQYFMKILDEKINAKMNRDEIKYFYKNNSLKLLRKNIVDNLNTIGSEKKSYYQVFDNIQNEIKIIKILQEKDISIGTPKSNTIRYSLPNGDIENIFDSENTSHYITINNTINTYSENVKIIFDLLRIKFNVTATGFSMDNEILDSFNIPSEFIDISIGYLEDEHYNDFIKDNTNEHNLLNKNVLSFIAKDNSNKIIQTCILGYSVRDICLDLIKILFETKFFPWFDLKYSKRLERLGVFLGLLSIHDNTKEFDKLMRNVFNFTFNLNLFPSEFPFDSPIFDQTQINQFKTNIDNLTNYKNIKFNPHYISPLKQEYKFFRSIIACFVISQVICDYNKTNPLNLLNYVRFFLGYIPVTDNKKHERFCLEYTDMKFVFQKLIIIYETIVNLHGKCNVQIGGSYEDIFDYEFKINNRKIISGMGRDGSILKILNY